MSTLVSYVFSVTGIALALMAIGAICAWRRPASWIRRTVIATEMLVAVSTIAIVPYGIGRMLAWGYHPFNATEADLGTGPIAIVVLAAGDVDIIGWDSHLPMPMPVEAAHILEASRVFRLVANSWIISSGGPGAETVVPSSLVMRDVLVRLGVPADRIVLESTSLNTHDEAVLVAPVLHSLHVQQVVLVTSRTHMRRALGAFRAAGWRAIPAIATDPHRPLARWQWVLPTDRGLDATSDVVHELLGLAYYWTRGWWRS